MGPRLLRICFRLRGGSRAEYERATTQAATAIAAVPGLRWKIWPIGDTGLAGGLYLFDDEVALRAYLDGPIVAHLKGAPFVADLAIEEYGILEAPTAITRGPVVAGAAVA